jgi:hypothetical protein
MLSIDSQKKTMLSLTASGQITRCDMAGFLFQTLF